MVLWDMVQVERKMKNEIEDESTRLINTAISTNGSANVVWSSYSAGWLFGRSLALRLCCHARPSVATVCSGLLIIIIITAIIIRNPTNSPFPQLRCILL